LGWCARRTALADMVPDRGLAGTIRKRLEIDGDKVSDLHLWRLGPRPCRPDCGGSWPTIRSGRRSISSGSTASKGFRT